MTTGLTPKEAAEKWLSEFAEVLGVEKRQLVLENAPRQPGDGITVLTYRQILGEWPVENAFVRLGVRRGHPDRVVYVGARLARSPQRPFPQEIVTAQAAVEFLQSLPAYTNWIVWQQPQKVVLTHEVDGTLVAVGHAWKIGAASSRSGVRRAVTFFVDSTTGELVETRNEVYRFGVTGRVTGGATPGTRPDLPDNPPVDTTMTGARVFSPTGTTAFTDGNGAYTVDTNTRTTGTVEADLTGQWVTVHNASGSNLTLEHDVIRFLPMFDFRFNASSTEFSTAQVNAFVHATQAHDFYKSRQPDFSGLDQSIDCRVNQQIGQACGGVFDALDLSIDLTRSTDACPNAAYASIITHEYGHFIVNRLGFPSPQLTFGEGFSDSLAVLIHDDPRMGRDFNGPGLSVRDIAAANQQFPCAGPIHTCGQVLAGVWWDTKVAFQADFGDTEGLVLTRQLFTDWSRIATGASGQNSAHPQTAIEMLVADDNDDDFSNLTPRFREICNALALHNIPCPVSDCNGNGRADDEDLALGRSNDCTGNGVPDECEPDCDRNGRADSCDLQDGLLVDDDANSVPDGCQSVLVVPSAQHPDLSSAIQAAQPGDTVVVAPGVYTGATNKNLDFDGKILTISCLDPGPCVIDCEGDGRGFYFHRKETKNSVVDGFTIINGDPRNIPQDGGAVSCFDSSPRIRRCRLIGNSTQGKGGGLWCSFANPTVEDTVIAENTARKQGGGIALSHASPKVLRCTLTANRTISGVGLHVDGESHPMLRGCVVWTDRRGLDSDISIVSGSAAVSFSDVRGGWTGDGNLDLDPQFVNPSSGDYRLSSGSPLINLGDPADSAVSGLDAGGEPRVAGCRVDIGALETDISQLAGDFNADGKQDLRDVGLFLRCFDAARGNPTWRDACECVFDSNSDRRVDLDDLPSFLDSLRGP